VFYAFVVPICLIYSPSVLEQGNQTDCTKYRSEGIYPRVDQATQHRGDNNLVDQIIAGMALQLHE